MRVVGGDEVGWSRTERHPRDRGGNQARREGREHERQAERAEQHLEREQRAAQGDVVNRRHPRARSRCHEQPALPSGQARPVAQPGRDRRTDLLRRGLATERGAEPDDHDRLHRAREAAQQRQLPRPQPQRLRDVSPAEPRKADRADAGDHTAAGQHEHPARVRAAFDAFQEMAVLVGPGEMLNGMQQPDQRRAADAGGHPDQHDQHPEARAVARDDPAAGNVWLSGGDRGHPAQSDGRAGRQAPNGLVAGFLRCRRRGLYAYPRRPQPPPRSGIPNHRSAQAPMNLSISGLFVPSGVLRSRTEAPAWSAAQNRFHPTPKGSLKDFRGAMTRYPIRSCRSFVAGLES